MATIKDNMTIYDLINDLVHNQQIDFETDSVKKIIAFAYYMGRETACKETSDKYNKILAGQKERANNCRYHNMAMAIIGDIDYIYSGDYGQIMIKTFGSDKTAVPIDAEIKKDDDAPVDWRSMYPGLM